MEKMRSSDLVGLASSVLAWAWTLVVRVLQAFLGWDPRGESCQDVRAYEVARYASLTQFSASILDTYIPRCRRLTQLHFGRIVSNPDAPQAFSENVGYNMTCAAFQTNPLVSPGPLVRAEGPLRRRALTAPAVVVSGTISSSRTRATRCTPTLPSRSS